MAETAEVAYAPAISFALKDALDGYAELTADLATELSIKRPHPRDQMRREQIETALSRMAETINEECACRAEFTPSPRTSPSSWAACREVAARSIRRQSGIGTEEA